MAKKYQHIDDLFKENVNFIVQDLAAYGMGNMTLESYIQLSLSQMPNQRRFKTFR